MTLANRDGTGGNHGKQDIDVQYKEVNLRTGVWNKAAWVRQWGTERVQRQEEGRAAERSGAKMKVTAMTDTKVKEMS